MISYSPFEQVIFNLEANDLATLRTVPEGWFIEYKQAFVGDPVTAAIGKSVSAFANHYGGWLFYGIKGNRDSRIAESFDGIPRSLVPRYEQELTNAARHHVNPAPFFHHKVVHGPSIELGLATDQSIVIIHVPSGHNAPYIHSSGRIYRRVADSSDPRPETDRTTLDLLHQRGQADRSKLSEFLVRKPVLSRAESENITFLRLLLLADPLEDRDLAIRMKFDDFSAIMARVDREAGGVAFDNSYGSTDSLIAWQTAGNNPYNLAFTWRVFRNSANEIILPLPSQTFVAGNAPLGKFLSGYNTAADFIDLCNKLKVNAGRVLDVNFLFAAIQAVVRKYIILAKENDWPNTFYAKAVVHNAWRTVPFLDTGVYSEFLRNNGLPFIQDELLIAPSETTPESLVELHWDSKDDQKARLARDLESTMRILSPILWALGLPPQRCLPYTPETVMDIFNLLARAQAAQRERAQK